MSSFGRYRPYNTPIHKLDSRIKMIALIIFMVSVFLNYGTPWMNLAIYGVIFIILLVISIIGKASFLSLFRSLKALWVMVLLLLVINVFFYAGDKTGTILFTIGSVNVYLGAIVNVSYIFLRLVLILMLTNILTATTKPMDLTGAIEFLLYPLKLIRVPIHKFAMALSLALRFVPTFSEESKRIMKAQASRGVDYNHGKFKEKVKALISLIIPLFISALSTSGELADAMEARGYDPDAKRTRFKTQHWSVSDTIATILLCLFFSLMIVAVYYKFDLFAYLNIVTPEI